MAATSKGSAGGASTGGKRQPGDRRRPEEDDPFDVWLRRGMRDLYGAVAAEPVPDAWLRLIADACPAREERSPAVGRDEGDAGGPEERTRQDELPAQPRHGTTSACDGDRTVHVVDDDEPVRESVAMLLRSADILARTYPDGHIFLRALAAAKKDDSGCVLTALRMPGLDGLELLRGLRKRGVGLPVLVMSGSGDALTVTEVMHAGAVGVLEKPFDDKALLAAVREALDTTGVERGTRAAARIALLLPREREVLLLLMAGRPNKAVGHELGLDLRTVELHRARLMDRLEVNSLAGAVQLAVQAGLA